MKRINFLIPEKLLNALDSYIKESGEYTDRTQFILEAIREKLKQNKKA